MLGATLVVLKLKSKARHFYLHKNKTLKHKLQTIILPKYILPQIISMKQNLRKPF